jgi:hypothetical protein
LPKLSLVLLLATALSAQSDASLTEQVRRVEIAFAKTMADRDHAAFTSFLAEEAIFISTNRVLRGAREVAAAWKRFYEGPQAPFSWEPDQVQVMNPFTPAATHLPVAGRTRIHLKPRRRLASDA